MFHQKLSLFFLIFVISYSCVRSQDATCGATQVHLSLGDAYYRVSQNATQQVPDTIGNNQAYLVWNSVQNCNFFVDIVNKNTSQIVQSLAVTGGELFTYEFPGEGDGAAPIVYQTTTYTALISGLQYEVLYEYSILSEANETLAGPSSLMLGSPYGNTTASRKILIVGDIDAFENGMQTIQALSNLAETNYTDYAGLIQLGDIGYNLDDENGKRGDDFFTAIEPFASQWPLILAMGNHDDYDKAVFAHMRIRNPLYSFSSNNYFSVNWEGIHFVVVNTPLYETLTDDQKAAMFAWAENDLANANTTANRAQWPWIVFVTHFPIYCTVQEVDPAKEAKGCAVAYTQRQQWDELFHKYSVDLVLEADKHAYERMGPIYANVSGTFTETANDPTHHNIINPNATVYILNGIGGNNDFTYPEWNASGYSYFRDVRPAYGVLYTQNNTGDIRLIYEHYVSATNEKIDYMNLIRLKPAASFFEEVRSNPLFAIIAALVGVGVILGAGYWYWKKRQDQLEAQGGDYLRNVERNIPLVALKD